MITTPPKTVGLLGCGLIYQQVRQQLEQHCVLLTLKLEDFALAEQTCALFLSIHDTWQPRTQSILNRYSLQWRIPWLRAYVGWGQGVIGPCVFPWESGCMTCAETRQLAAREDAPHCIALNKYLSNACLQPSPHASWLTSFSQEILTALLVEEVTTFLKASEHVRTRNALITLQLDTCQLRLHRFLPDPRCPDCQLLPEDTAAAAMLTLQPQQKLTPSTYRVRTLTPELQRLQKLYADKQTGIIRSLVKDNDSPNASATATIGIDRGRRSEMGLGRTMSYEASQCAAIAEALERYGGRIPGGKRTSVRASYRELGQQALDPTLLGLPSPVQYALPGYPYSPYHHDRVYNWIWGYSWQRQQPILVPERYIYYDMSTEDTPDRRFAYETSNGCALGSCLEEAIFYGIQEIAERDAFLMTWYTRMRVPRLDLSTTTDRSSNLLIERIEAMTGCTVYAFNTTLEQGIPSFWVMGVDEQDRPAHPKVVCAAGAHLHPEKALASALSELGALLIVMKKRYQDGQQRLASLIADPYAVVEMDDHALLYCLPEAFERLHFLYHSSHYQTMPAAFASFYEREPGWDLHADLSELLTRYAASGLDVIIVDQTTPEQRAGQFCCVKVIIPGTLPMTFGHAARRISGLPRLSTVPYMLGYAAQPLTDAEINPYPHPFP